jgi:hypothetical protein
MGKARKFKPFTTIPNDLDDKEIRKRAAELRAQDKDRYDRVMAEIDKDEAEAMKRLKAVRERRQIVRLAGYYGSAVDGGVEHGDM